MKHSRTEIQEHNTRRKAPEDYSLFLQRLEDGAPFAAYTHLGDIFLSLNQMEPALRTHYRAQIALHHPTQEIVERLRLQYDHTYRRILDLAGYAPKLTEEEIVLLRTLRDQLFSVYNLFEQAFAISLPSVAELDNAINRHLARYFRNRRHRA